MAYQSASLARPWITQPTRMDLVMDFRNNRVMRYSESRYPRDFLFSGTNVTTPQGGFFYDPARSGLGDAILRFPGSPSIATNSQRRELPAFQLLQVRDRAETA